MPLFFSLYNAAYCQHQWLFHCNFRYHSISWLSVFSAEPWHGFCSSPLGVVFPHVVIHCASILAIRGALLPTHVLHTCIGYKAYFLSPPGEFGGLCMWHSIFFFSDFSGLLFFALRSSQRLCQELCTDCLFHCHFSANLCMPLRVLSQLQAVIGCLWLCTMWLRHCAPARCFFLHMCCTVGLRLSHTGLVDCHL